MAQKSITVQTPDGDKLTVKRWRSASGYGTVAGMAIGHKTDASSSGYWWQPLVLGLRGARERETLEPIARRLYDNAKAVGIITYETFHDVAE